MDQYSSFPRRVVVTGLGAITSIGHNTADFWAGLVAGRCGIERVTHFDTTNFASQIGAEVRDWDATLHMDPKEARRNDRYTHFGFCAARQAFKDSGKQITVKVYKDAGHAFLNNTHGSYNEAAAKEAWQLAVDFFKQNLV